MVCFLVLLRRLYKRLVAFFKNWVKINDTIEEKMKKAAFSRQSTFIHHQQLLKNIEFVNEELKEFNPKMKRLQELDLFVLDNSLRETTVGQLRGHTLEDKMAIYQEVKNAGFKYIIVESFNHMTRLGDVFLEKIAEGGEDMNNMFAFTEFVEVIDENRIPKEDIPVGFIKSKKLGIRNLIIEIDLCYHAIDYEIFNAKTLCALLINRLEWVKLNLSKDSLVFINFRDFAECMHFYPIRVFRLVNFISSLPPEHRPFGILYEELGKYFPEQMGVWTRSIRNEMENCGWADGLLLIHVHEQWGMGDSTQIECLANGANGIWSGMCAEGAAMGHASTCVTIMNLIRMGNKKVQEKYNCTYLREGAQNVTRITTGYDPHPKQVVYGARSLDVIFGLDPKKDKSEFDYSEFLGIKPEMRISTLASAEMIKKKLIDFFGPHQCFTDEIGLKMKNKLLENLREGRKEESNSMVGIAILFDQAGGHLTDEMSEAIEKDKNFSVHIDNLINQIRNRWDVWDASDGTKDDHVTFDAFYNGFMAPYFGCYRCEDSRKGLQAIDMDNDGMVDWKEFALYLKWAGRQYPETKTPEELLDITFRKGLIPAMQDEILSEDNQPVENGLPSTMNNSENTFFKTYHYDGLDGFLAEDEGYRSIPALPNMDEYHVVED